jgi:hypothetical protein
MVQRASVAGRALIQDRDQPDIQDRDQPNDVHKSGYPVPIL